VPAPLPPGQRPALTYSIRLRPGSDFQAMAEDGNTIGFLDVRNELAGTLEETGWFSSVTQREAGQDPADLHLDVQLVVTANDVILFASGMTLFIIPTWRTVTFDLSAEVQASDGRWHRYEFADQARDLYWVPFLLGMSFAPWGGVYVDVRENLYRSLLLALHEDGLLVKR
jgi:hypothetical protein